MQLIKPDVNINFIDKRNIAYLLSALMLLATIVSLVIHKGPKYGIDFEGGTLIQVKFDAPTSMDTIKNSLNTLGLKNSTVQLFGEKKENEYLVRTDLTIIDSEAFSKKMQDVFKETTGTLADIRRVEMVGPQVGKDLKEKALLAMFYTLLFIAIYISGRFELKWLLSGFIAVVLIGALTLIMKICDYFSFQNSMPLLIASALVVTLVLFWVFKLKYAMGAIVALIHDVAITVGIFSILDIEFTLPVIAALLTIIGYSLNDTIIVFDRIRENATKTKKIIFGTVINTSINETLSRTLITALTTLVVVVALYLMGGAIIHDFAFAMMIGIIVGTYSSIFVASPILLAWRGVKK
jgi:preprotein translocase subunit SecF